MELVRSNAQSELSPFERGMHALKSGKTERAYADSVGRANSTVHKEMVAARVAEACADVGANLTDRFSQLVEVHAAPRWLWPALVEHQLAEGATVDAMRRVVAGLLTSVPESRAVDPV